VTYRPAQKGQDFSPWLHELRGHSGVYVFRSALTKTILYVGESHTRNLARTIKRHFWGWADRTNRHHYTVGLLPVEVGVRIVPSNRAIDEQNRLILRLAPRHNKQTPRDAVPF
jgi:hypothetical protein